MTEKNEKVIISETGLYFSSKINELSKQVKKRMSSTVVLEFFRGFFYSLKVVIILFTDITITLKCKYNAKIFSFEFT